MAWVEMYLVKGSTSDFSKAALVDDLKVAGFEESIARTIADHVEKKRSEKWTMDMGRQEAIRQAQGMLMSAHAALDVFRTSTLPTTGRQDHLEREPPLSERLADSSLS
jgi:hypothetical protein